MTPEAAEFCRRRDEKRQAWLRDVHNWRMEQHAMKTRRMMAIARYEAEALRAPRPDPGPMWVLVDGRPMAYGPLTKRLVREEINSWFLH